MDSSSVIVRHLLEPSSAVNFNHQFLVQWYSITISMLHVAPTALTLVRVLSSFEAGLSDICIGIGAGRYYSDRVLLE